jgi:hypothetical protein
MSEELILTPDQQVVINQIDEFLADPSRETFTMAGVGGAGKTTCIRRALENQVGVLGATVSHSAKFVLSKSLKGVAECYTIAQLLGLRQYIQDDGKVKFYPQRNRRYKLPIESALIIVVDECSMIDDPTDAQLRSMKLSHAKIIYMGDPFQLPPINGDKDSITFDHTQAELLTAVRYSGPIADLGMRIRSEMEKFEDENDAPSKNFLNNWHADELENEERKSMVNEEGSGVIYIDDIDKLMEIAVTSFKTEDSEAMACIAYRNKSLDQINSVIRTQLYCAGDAEAAEELPEFMPGEMVICNGGYSVSTYDLDGRETKHSIIYNNQTFKVKESMSLRHGGQLSFAMNLEPKVDMPEGTGVYTLDWENGRYPYFEIVNEMKKNAQIDPKQWKAYYRYKDQWCWFNYGYALSSHKAQGRTFKDVIVFENDIFSTQRTTLKEKLQSFYVACTRAERRVYIYNKKFRVDQSGLPESVREELGL